LKLHGHQQKKKGNHYRDQSPEVRNLTSSRLEPPHLYYYRKSFNQWCCFW
jgi:hypothetical protein